ncbi:hypothetical protein Scep_019751 [Stephania cephalantha]|uniref:Uncharacterized protein n=1 Tax=Stephania cephalantha TaxID=152367 RepID=A0AAP0IBV8_9MAGN
MTCTKTTEAPKKIEQEKEKTANMGEKVGRRTQTSSYRKENELRRGTGASKKHGDLNDGVAAAQPSDLAGQQLGIRMSQATLVEPSTSVATESDRGEGREQENEGSESGGNDEEGQREDGEESKEEEEEEVEVRPSAKARGKAKFGPSDKVVADDSSKPFPGGLINHELLISFNNHVVAAIWNNKYVRQAVDVIKAWKALPPRESR